jgi:hypothetical protein
VHDSDHFGDVRHRHGLIVKRACTGKEIVSNRAVIEYRRLSEDLSAFISFTRLPRHEIVSGHNCSLHSDAVLGFHPNRWTFENPLTRERNHACVEGRICAHQQEAIEASSMWIGPDGSDRGLP